MLIRDALDRFEFDDQTVFNDKIGKIFAYAESIAIKDIQGLLRFDMEAFLLKAMKQSVFIDFLKQARAKVSVQIVSDLPHSCHQFPMICILHAFCLSALLAYNLPYCYPH